VHNYSLTGMDNRGSRFLARVAMGFSMTAGSFGCYLAVSARDHETRPR
jgi:hypothetical protein